MLTFKQWLAGLDQSTYLRFVRYAERRWGFLEKRGDSSPEDIVNEVFKRMLGSERATPMGNVDAKVHLEYVYQIIDSLGSHAYEKLRGRQTRPISDIVNEMDNEDAGAIDRLSTDTDKLRSEDNPANSADDSDLNETLENFKRQLSPELRQIFDLLLRQHSQKEIAERLQVSNATVSRRRTKLTEQWSAFCREHEPVAIF